jgi:NAD(P)-dependent dehydrogenase (short-subunit alcohol dehydrogenase family)
VPPVAEPTTSRAVPRRLEGLAVGVTGASSGIGRAVALRLAAEGAALVCCDLGPAPRAGGPEPEPDVPTDELIRRRGGQARFVVCDVTDAGAVEAAFSLLGDGEGRPWGVVLAAGVFARDVSILEETEDEHDWILSVNERGVWLGLRAAARLLAGPGGGGRVVAIASISGLVGMADEPAYCASKGAVINLVRAAALDLAPHGVTVNAVCPGFIATALLADKLRDPAQRAQLEARAPLGRVGTTEDVAAAVAYLVAPEAGFVTGIALPVDGGYTCC